MPINDEAKSPHREVSEYDPPVIGRPLTAQELAFSNIRESAKADGDPLPPVGGA